MKALDNFLTEELYQIIRQFNRPIILSLCLEIIQMLQVFSLQLNKSNLVKILRDSSRQSETFFQILQASLFLPFLEMIQVKTIDAFSIFMVTSFTIMTCFLSIVLLQFILRLLNFKLTHQTQRFLAFYTSIVFFFYTKLLQIPFFYCIFYIFFNSEHYPDYAVILAVCMLPVNILVTLFSAIFDFEYRIVISDGMARRDQPATYIIMFFSDIILVILHFSNLDSGLQIINFLLTSLKFLFSMKDLMYYKSSVNYVQIVGLFVYLVYTVILYISTSSATMINVDPVYMLIIITPFAIKLVSELRKIRLHAQLFTKHKKLTFFSQQDIYIRMISEVYLNGEDNTELSVQLKNLLYTSLIVKHLNKCMNVYCKCREMIKANNVIQSSFTDGGQRKKTEEQQQFGLVSEGFEQREFLKLHLVQKINQYIRLQNLQRNNNSKLQSVTQINFLNLSFNIDVEKIITKSYLELYKIKAKNDQINLKERYIFSTIEKRLKIQFDAFFNSSVYQNQRLQLKKVADFDEQKHNLDILLRDSLAMLREYYIFLSQDQINTDNLIEKNENIIKVKKSIQKVIKQQFDICPSNSTLHKQAYIYLNFFEGKGSTIKTLMQHSRNMMLKKLLKQDAGITLFSTDSCVVYISLMKPIGMMKCVSDSTEIMFQYKVKDFINKSCNMLMPLAIAQVHDKLLQKFIDSGSMLNIAAEQTKSFGLNRQGFIFPIFKRISLCYTGQDFGVAAHLQKENLTYHYILFDKNSMIIGITEQLFKQSLGFVLKDPNELGQYAIGNFIPLMLLNTRKNQLTENIQTCLLFPHSTQKLEELRGIQEPLEQNLPKFFNTFNIGNYGIFDISFNYCSMNMESKSEHIFRYILIKDFRRLKKKQEKYDIINQLKRQLNQELHLNLPIQNLELDQKKQQNQDQEEQEAQQRNLDNIQDIPANESNIEASQLQNQLQQQSQQQVLHSEVSNQISKSINEDKYIIEQDEEKVPMPVQESVQNQNSVFKQLRLKDNFEQIDQIQFAQLATPRSVNDDKLMQMEDLVGKSSNRQLLQQSQQQFISNQILSNNNINEMQNISGYFSNPPDGTLISPRSEQKVLIPQQQSSPINQKINYPTIKEENENVNNSYMIIQNKPGDISQQQASPKVVVDDLTQQNKNINSLQQDKKNLSNSQDLHHQIAQQLIGERQPQRNRTISQADNEPPLGQFHQSEKEHYSSQEQQSKQLDMNSMNLASNLSWSRNDKAGINNQRNYIQKSDQDSNKSGSSMDTSKKFEIIESIHNNQTQKVITQINLAGWFAFIILIISNTIVYIQLNSSFYYAIQTFQIMAVTPEIKDKFSVLIYHKEFIRCVDEFNPFEIKDPDQTPKSFSDQQIKFLLAFRKRIKEWILKQVYDVTGQFNQFNRENYMNLMIQVDDQRTLQSYTINYAEIILLFYANRYSFKNENPEVNTFVYNNYRSYVKSFAEAIEFNRSNAKDTVNSIKNVVVITLIIIELVGLMIVLILFPIYNLIQQRREKVLRLFGTFSQDKLNKYINIIENTIQNDVSEGRSFVRKIKYSQKKKTISIASGLKKFSWYIMFISVFCMGLLSLYPVINMVITYNFLDQYAMNSDEMIIYFLSKTHTIENYAANNLMLYQQLKGIPLSEDQIDHLKTLSTEHQIILTQVMSLEKNIDAKIRQNGDEYIDFVQQALYGDICNLLFVKYASLNVTVIDAVETKYYKNKCSFFMGGIVTKGVLRIYNAMYERFDGLLQLHLKNDLANFYQNLKQFDKGDSLYDLHQTYKYIQSLMELFRIKSIDLTNSQYSSVKLAQDVLFTISILILIFMFGVGWIKFLNYMNNLLNSTKLMLGIINIEYILENTYMLHYIHEELIMRKQ